MARVIYEELQDKEGNVHYLHTEDKVVFDENGNSLRGIMKEVQFEDYTGAAALPSIDTAMAGIVKGKRWTELFGNIKAALKGLVAKSMATENDLGDAFSAAKAYAVGDYAIHENVLYKFTAAKAAGAWDASKVQAVTVASELCELNGKMNNKVSYTQSGQVILKKDFVLDKDAYLNTPFVLESVSGSPFCPGISFHNPGKEGAALYLQGGSLILLKHTGEYYRIQMEFVGKQE